MIMPNYRLLGISLTRPRKLDTCAPHHTITKWPECLGVKCKIRSAKLQLTIYRGPLQDLPPIPNFTWPNLQSERQIFHPTLKQVKWTIENEIHHHQAWFENLNQTSPWPLPVAIIAANEQFVSGAEGGMGQDKLYGWLEAVERGGRLD